MGIFGTSSRSPSPDSVLLLALQWSMQCGENGLKTFRAASPKLKDKIQEKRWLFKRKEKRGVAESSISLLINQPIQRNSGALFFVSVRVLCDCFIKNDDLTKLCCISSKPKQNKVCSRQFLGRMHCAPQNHADSPPTIKLFNKAQPLTCNR